MEQNNFQGILDKLKEYEKLLSTDENDDSIDDQLAQQINLTLDELNAEIYNAQKEEYSKLSVKFINKSNNPNPTFAHEGDSGFDLRAALDEPLVLGPLERALVPTGLFFELEKGTELQVRPRSGLAIKNGIFVLNSPGTVDSHYRGEIKIILINFGESFTINNGDRIAQGVIMPVFGEGRVNLVQSDALNETTRGEGGFGSSGIK